MIQKLRVPLGFVVAGLVLYLAEPSAISIMVGAPVAIVGGIFRALAAGVIKKDSALATSGVYSLTRNPLYFGSSLLATGFAIMSANEIAAALLLVPFGLIYPTVMLREEAHLARLFPEEFRSIQIQGSTLLPTPDASVKRILLASSIPFEPRIQHRLGVCGRAFDSCRKMLDRVRSDQDSEQFSSDRSFAAVHRLVQWILTSFRLPAAEFIGRFVSSNDFQGMDATLRWHARSTLSMCFSNSEGVSAMAMKDSRVTDQT